MHRVVLILGSNIDKERMMPAAVRLLSQAVEMLAVSAVYEATAVGERDRPNFFNAAALIHTNESAVRLKDGLLADIERQLGRKRTDDINEPRTIDLDIVLFDDLVFDYIPADGRARHIPEPDLLRYAHCALPVADLLPSMVHPETGETMRAIAARVAQRVAVEGSLAIWKRDDVDLRPSRD